jgi:hypothetical protein
VRRNLRTAIAIARADFRERTRSYAFLVALGLTCWLGWLASEGTLRVELGPWRGVLDSAWIGGSLAVIAATFLSLFGGWLVRGTIARDRATGVGEIFATTPLTRPAYLVGKWLSQFVYLSSLALVLAPLSVYMLLRNAEAPGLDLVRLWLPMLLVALPALAFVSGLVVAFEVLPLVRGGLGNVAWLFLWAGIFAASLQTGTFDFSGLGATRASLRADLRAEAGVDEEGMRVGGGPRRATRTFTWHGFDWTPGFVASRLARARLALADPALVAARGTRFRGGADPRGVPATRLAPAPCGVRGRSARRRPSARRAARARDRRRRRRGARGDRGGRGVPAGAQLCAGPLGREPAALRGDLHLPWYVAVQTPALDFMGATAAPHPWPFAVAVPVLLAAAALGRARRP